MLETTVDGLWVLQALTKIERTCPELGLRPLIPRLDTPEEARRHPMAAELAAIGAVGADGVVDSMITEWLTVISRRDIALVVSINAPGREPTRVSISRFATWWVVMERNDVMVRLHPAGAASDEATASELVVGQIEQLCGVSAAAQLRPATLDTARLLEGVRDQDSLRAFLLSQGLDSSQIQILSAAADRERCAHADIVAVQAGIGPQEMGRLTVGDSAVSLIDTDQGRICAENVVGGDGRRYQVLSPGTRSDIAGAVHRLIRGIPAGDQWYAHRRVV